MSAAALEGAGVGLHTFAIAEDLRLGRLEAILPGYAVEGTFGDSVYAVFLPNRFAASKMRVFVDFLIARFADGGSWQ